MWTQSFTAPTENEGVRVPLLLSVLISLYACSPTRVLTPLSLDDVEEALESPSGELEITDAKGLAYTVLATDRLVSTFTIAAPELPGFQRSPLFDPRDLGDCVREHNRGFDIDYVCLGHPSGTLRVEATGEFANENGDYDVKLDAISIEEGIVIEGSAMMRVSGIANPTSPERTVVAPIAYVAGLPERFEAVERTAVVLNNDRGDETLSCVTTTLQKTFVFRSLESPDPEELLYTVRDKKNVWDCISRLEGLSILKSECRTPIGQGDFAVLEF